MLDYTMTRLFEIFSSSAILFMHYWLYILQCFYLVIISSVCLIIVMVCLFYCCLHWWYKNLSQDFNIYTGSTCRNVCCRFQHRSVAMLWAVFWVKVRTDPMRTSSSCMRSTVFGFSLSQRLHMSSRPPSLTEPLSLFSWGCRGSIHSWTTTSR